MVKEGRQNDGGIGDLHSHARAVGLPDEVINYMSRRRGSVVPAFQRAMIGETGELIRHLESAGLDRSAAEGFANYIHRHHSGKKSM
ncbi:MAG: hypothetical protein ABIG96_01345 [Candidatus Micrarchaeota archaeon]